MLSQPIPLVEKAAAGLTAGGLGAMVGSPADLALIRMQSDSTLPVAQRRNYKGVGDALVRRAACSACKPVPAQQHYHSHRAGQTRLLSIIQGADRSAAELPAACASQV